MSTTTGRELSIDEMVDQLSIYKARRFTRRMTQLLANFAAARPGVYGMRSSWPNIVPVGMVFALKHDAGIHVKWTAALSLPHYSVHSTVGGAALDAIQVDVPSYDPGRGHMGFKDCPDVVGPRGGACRATGPRWSAPHITDMTTGDYVNAMWCNQHIGAARARAAAAPKPPSNTGGVLIATFPEFDWDHYYAENQLKVRDNAPPAPATDARPRLRVIDGGLA